MKNLISLFLLLALLSGAMHAQPVVPPATQAEAEAGTGTSPRVWSPLRVKQAIDEHAGGGGGTPGGSDGQIQYNNGGAFGGAAMTYDDSTGVYTIAGATIRTPAVISITEASPDTGTIDITKAYSQATIDEATTLTPSAAGTAGQFLTHTVFNAQASALTVTVDTATDFTFTVPATGYVTVLLRSDSTGWNLEGGQTSAIGLTADTTPDSTGLIAVTNPTTGEVTKSTVAEIVATGGSTESTISPTQLSADTDNWNPTGLSTATVIRVDTDASLRYLSSITAPATTQRLRLHNISANTLIIKDQSAELGTAANRIICGGYDLPLFPGDTLELNYDDASSRWRVADPMAKVIPPRRFGWYGVRPSWASSASDTGIFGASGTVSGASAANTFTAGDSTNVTPYLVQTTGTDTTGRAHMGNNNMGVLVGNNWYWRWSSRVNVVTLSDGTETFLYRNGLMDATNGDSVDGVYLRYTHSVNSGNFELVLRSNSSETAVNCSAGPVANTWFDIAITITPTRVEAYKDGVIIGSTTTMTHLPSGSGRQTGPGAVIIKSAGTSARTAGLQSFELVGYKGVP